MDSPVKAWTSARWHAFVVSVLRAGTRRYPPKYETLKKAYFETKTNEKTKRKAKHYKCAVCEGHFPSKEVQIDHKEPVVSARGFTSWDEYIKRLFCGPENLQVLCKLCHLLKSKKEKELSKLTRK